MTPFPGDSRKKTRLYNESVKNFTDLLHVITLLF